MFKISHTQIEGVKNVVPIHRLGGEMGGQLFGVFSNLRNTNLKLMEWLKMLTTLAHIYACLSSPAPQPWWLAITTNL